MSFKAFKTWRRSARLLPVLLLGAWALPAQAGVAIDRLNAFFATKEGLRASFVQTVQAPAFDQPEVSRGTLMLLRPNRFRWDYQEPYKQQIVADGQRLWLYDEELEQVVVKPLDKALGDTPAMLLSGSGVIGERFTVEELPDRGDGLAWVQLIPKQADTGFEAVRLGFDARDLRRMALVDGFGQVTRMQFSDVVRDPNIKPAAFRFVPPPGVDVIGDPGEPAAGDDARP